MLDEHRVTDEELRRQIGTRLLEGRLPSVNGVSQSHRGTGRPCVVCRRAIEPTEVERQVGGLGASLFAHETCYKLWREESVARRGHGKVLTALLCLDASAREQALERERA